MTNTVREKVDTIVSRAFDRYGYFSPDVDRAEFFSICVEIVLDVSDLIDSKKLPNAKLLKSEIVRSLYILAFDKKKISTLLKYIFDEIEKETRLVREYRTYEKLILEAVNDYESLFKTGIVEYLNNLEQYKVSKLITRPHNKKFFPVREEFENSRLRVKFSQIFNNSIKNKTNLITRAVFDINSITSDSDVIDYEIPEDINLDLLTATFSGGGKKIYQDVINLFNSANEFGGYQGSFSGAVDYQSKYYGYVIAASYGRKTEFLNEEFGNFEKVFEQRTLQNNEIPGLKFLEPVFRRGEGNGTNPLVEKFAGGIKDRYVENTATGDSIDIVRLTLESIYISCLKVGNSIQDKSSLQMDILSRVFPSSLELNKSAGGLTGGVYTLLSGHISLSTLLGPGNIPDYPVVDQFGSIKQQIDSLIDSFKTTGFKPGGYVPSLELNYHEPRKSVIRERIRSLGFTELEIESIMSADNFSELLNSLAPLSDSNDVISFFRAFDLTKLIYEFGGQNAIDEYINFLYGKDEEQSLIRLLGFLDVNRTQGSVIAGSRYPKLIGYLVSLTYSVNPEQLQIFNEFLKDNQLDLLESVSKLIEQGQNTVILPKDKISLLSGVVAQMVVSDNSGYESQKPTWNSLIEKSAGNSGPSVKGMYNEREGITPTELYEILNNPSATSPLGSMLNGVRGGRLTSILRYCNIFGLLYSLSDYRNSYQLMNEPAEKYEKLLELVSNLETLSDNLELGALVLENRESFQADFSEPLVQVQGKVFEAVVDVVSGGDGSKFGLAEPPGTGNSRLPNGVRIDNSLTPEEASVLVVGSPGAGSQQSALSVDSGSYIRLSLSNILSQGVIFEQDMPLEQSPGQDANVPGKDKSLQVQVYEKGNTILQAKSKFDPVESCKRFGGTDCDQLGIDKCEGSGYNKSFYPESGYGTESPIPGILIDRPLGQGLTVEIVPNTYVKSDTNYYYSLQGITEVSRSPVFKDNEMLCSSIKDPFEYSACISMLKCKRFNPPYRGKYFFEFCPRSLFGGRLAP